MPKRLRSCTPLDQVIGPVIRVPISAPPPVEPLGGPAFSMTIDVAYRSASALVLGGSGFIGAWTARALHARGAIVAVAARDAERA